MWPAASTVDVEVRNELWRNWDDASTPTIIARQTVPARIAGQAVPPLGATTTAAIAAAERSLSRFARAAAGRAIGGHVPLVLLRADAVASSQIEAIATSTERLSVALARDRGPLDHDDASLIADHVEVAQRLLDDDRPVDVDWLLRAQSAVLRHDRSIAPRHRGAWRDCAVWIGTSREFADFEGPDHSLVPELVDDLVAFVSRRDIHPIVHSAIAHAQFETVHPFVDGNGRVGRLLIHRLLDAAGTPVPVAHGLLADTDIYIAGLTAYRAGDLDNWVTTFATAIRTAADVGEVLLDRLAAVRRHLHEIVPTRGRSATQRLLDDLVTQPAITASEITSRYGVTTARASQILNQLHDAGILRRSDLATGRERVWVAPDVIAALDSINHGPRRSGPTGPDC